MQTKDWLLCGYKDAQEREPYKRAPEAARHIGEGSPSLADLKDNTAAAYFEGWNAGIKDNVARILRRAHHDTMQALQS